VLVELINSTLTKRPLNEKVFESASESDWQQCYDMALTQGVLATTFKAMSSLPIELRPSFTLWSKWMAYMQSVAELSHYKREVVKKIGAWLNEDGLSTTILKGFSLSALYPNPNLREFSDIDIFSGENYEAVNNCFSKHNVKVDSADGHHAYLNVDGISVEHHFAFSNTKVKKGLIGPEEALQDLVVKDRQPTNIQGVYYPNPLFTASFVGWHAYEHFLQEMIQLRHLIDWVLALNQLSEIDAETLSSIKWKTKWGLFTDTLTAIALHQLDLPQEWFSNKELESSATISPEQEQKVWNDILYAPRTPKSKYSSYRRICIAKRILKNSWKFKEYANIKSSQLLLREFVGHFSKKIFNL
jgi:hypothetical protein